MWKSKTLLTCLFSIVVFSASLFVTSESVDAQQSTEQSAQEAGKAAIDIKVISEMDLEQIRGRLKEGWVDYETQLQMIMRTRLPEEQEFIGRLVLLIQEEKIPKTLVDQAWGWVRNNRPHSPYPFIYFERVLKLQAEKLEIAVPGFDRKLYSDRFSERGTRTTQRGRSFQRKRR